MHIVLFGARGNIGRRIAREAMARGHRVTAAVRDPGRVTPALAASAPVVDGAPADEGALLAVVSGDVTDPTQVATLARGADAVVSAVGNTRTPAGPAPVALFPEAARALLAGLRAAGGRRLLVVGGAGSLEVTPGVQVVDTPDFPALYRGDALGQREALAVYRSDAAGDVDWTYVSPAAAIGPGERTGRYRTGTDQLLVDAHGTSRISYDDYAVALVDELERPRHPRRRMTVAY